MGRACLAHCALAELEKISAEEMRELARDIIGHCMKKALAIVWGVWHGEHDFVPEVAKP